MNTLESSSPSKKPIREKESTRKTQPLAVICTISPSNPRSFGECKPLEGTVTLASMLFEKTD